MRRAGDGHSAGHRLQLPLPCQQAPQAAAERLCAPPSSRCPAVTKGWHADHKTLHATCRLYIRAGLVKYKRSVKCYSHGMGIILEPIIPCDTLSASCYMCALHLPRVRWVAVNLTPRHQGLARGWNVPLNVMPGLDRGVLGGAA